MKLARKAMSWDEVMKISLSQHMINCHKSFLATTPGLIMLGTKRIPSAYNFPLTKMKLHHQMWMLCTWESANWNIYETPFVNDTKLIARKMAKYAIQKKGPNIHFTLGRLQKFWGICVLFIAQGMVNGILEWEECWYSPGSVWLIFFHLWNGEFRIEVSVSLFLKVCSI